MSGLFLKYLNGPHFVMLADYETNLPFTTEFSLTGPSNCLNLQCASAAPTRFLRLFLGNGSQAQETGRRDMSLLIFVQDTNQENVSWSLTTRQSS